MPCCNFLYCLQRSLPRASWWALRFTVVWGAIGKHGFSERGLQERCQTHSAGDLEVQLLAVGFGNEVRETLMELDFSNALTLDPMGLKKLLTKNKTSYTAAFAARIRANPGLPVRTPEDFRTAIKKLWRLT